MLETLYRIFDGHWHHLVAGFGSLHIDTICIRCGRTFSGAQRPWNSKMLPSNIENTHTANQARSAREYAMNRKSVI